MRINAERRTKVVLFFTFPIPLLFSFCQAAFLPCFTGAAVHLPFGRAPFRTPCKWQLHGQNGSKLKQY
jgi:hypothetical protein